MHVTGRSGSKTHKVVISYQSVGVRRNKAGRFQASQHDRGAAPEHTKRLGGEFKRLYVFVW
jgi:hypothetical protein